MDNRKQMRDAIRVRLGIIPPGDSGGAVGDAPAASPWPSNAMANRSIREAVLYVARKTDIAMPGEPISVSIPAQTAVGPYYLNEDNPLFMKPAFEGLETIRTAWWSESSSDYDLVMTNLEEQDKSQPNWTSEEVGTPNRIWLVGRTLYLAPAPANAGTLHLIGRQAPLYPLSDEDTLSGLPPTFHPVVYDEAARFLCLTRMAVPQYALLHQMLAQRVAEGLKDLTEGQEEEESGDVPRMTFVNTYRASRRRI